jgi:hypothetical protein
MEGGGFWTNMVTGDDDVAGLEDLYFPMTQETLEIEDMPTEVQGIDAPVQPRESAPCPRSTVKKAAAT